MKELSLMTEVLQRESPWVRFVSPSPFQLEGSVSFSAPFDCRFAVFRDVWERFVYFCR